jgi:GDPmannose 4,6-dehydratase
MTVGQMLDKLLELSTVKNIKVEVDPERLRPSDVTLQIPCIEKFQKVTDWKPKILFENTLKDTLEYCRNFYEK